MSIENFYPTSSTILTYCEYIPVIQFIPVSPVRKSVFIKVCVLRVVFDLSFCHNNKQLNKCMSQQQRQSFRNLC